MAIYVPKADYSSVSNAINFKGYAEQSKYVTESNKLTVRSNQVGDQQIENMQAQMDRKKVSQVIHGIVEVAKVGAQWYQAIDGAITESQMEKAKGSVLDTTTQYSKLIGESRLNGTTQAVQNADGMWEIQVDQGVVDWQNAQLKAIDASNDTKEVKQWKRESLMKAFSTGQDSLIGDVLKDTVQQREQAYSQNIAKAMQFDIDAGGSYENGLATISSRSDLSAAQKQTQADAYTHAVDKGYAKKAVSQIAAAYGIGKATEAAYALDGFSIGEVQDMVATATKTDSQITKGVTESAVSLMQDGLGSGKTPAEIYSQLDKALESSPEERKQFALDAAKDAHIAWATSKGYEMWNEDSESVDIAHLQSQRDSIIKKDGEANLTIFAGLDKTQETFASFYDKRIAAIEKEVTSYGKSLTTAQIKENKQFIDATFESLKAGTISPATAMQAISGLSGNTPGEYEDDLYEMKILNMIKDNIVPDAYKPSVTKFMSEMEGLKFGVTTNKTLTDEETGKIAQARMFANEAIATLFMGTATNNMTMDQFTKALTEIKQTFVGKSISALESGTVEDKWKMFNDPTSLDDALEKNQQFGHMDTSPVILGQNGQIQWAKPEMKATYDAIATEIGQQLKTQFGITVTSAPSPLMIEGKPYPVPIIQGETQAGGRHWFAVDKDDIFTSKDGKTWEHWASFETTKKFNNNSQVNSFFDQFRNDQAYTKKEQRIQAYDAKVQENDPTGKHKQRY